jgi:hypothetical protein
MDQSYRISILLVVTWLSVNELLLAQVTFPGILIPQGVSWTALRAVQTLLVTLFI